MTARSVGEGIDPGERLSADDMATRREAEFLERALAARASAAARGASSTPGVCSNCGSACAAAQVYCDADCRADHERRAGAAPRRFSAGGG